MVDKIVSPNSDEPPLEGSSRRFQNWVELITDLDLFSGTGSPEGVIEAKQKSLYMDESGTAGSILYIKRDADIGGDRSQGWVLV